MALRAISLFAGVGGLDLGASLARPTRCVCYVEREAYSAAILVTRMGDAFLAPAPVWSDVATFNGRRWRGVVDLVLASPPCQPYSVAGSRRGLADERGGFVLGHVARIIGELGAPLVFMENVADWIAGGFFRDFGERLFRLGYRIPPPLLVTARQVGAPHLRERAFVLVYRDGHGLRELRRRGLHSERPAGGFTDDGGAELGDAARGGCGVVGHAALAGRGGHVDGDGVDVGDAHGERSHGRANRIEVGRQAAAPSADRRGTVPGTSRARLPLAESRELSGPQRHDEGGAAPELCRALFPPGPDATDEWRRIVIEYPDLAPAVEPGFCVLVDGVAYVVDASRAPQLRATGNGVVPLAAGIAFDFLLSEIGL